MRDPQDDCFTTTLHPVFMDDLCQEVISTSKPIKERRHGVRRGPCRDGSAGGPRTSAAGEERTDDRSRPRVS